MRGRTVLLIFGLALVVRIAFVQWAPARPTGDGIIYNLHAGRILLGQGYVNHDASPAIRWMPGWPILLAGVYALAGSVKPLYGMYTNAFLASLTAVLATAIGTRIFHWRVGVLAGLLYALWPGNIYFSATLFTDTLFSFLFFLTIYGLVLAWQAEGRRERDWLLAGSGACLGLAAMVKAEPLALVPLISLFLWRIAQSWREFLRFAAFTFIATGLVMTPWIVRNYVTFGRFLPTSGAGGVIVWIGNHEGASGGNDLNAGLRYARRFSHLTDAEKTLAQNYYGWRDAFEFASTHPREELGIVLNKLRLTYSGDAAGAEFIRGHFGKDKWFISEWMTTRLSLIANLYWWAMCALVALGLTTLGSWPREARMLLLGVVATWFGLHLVFLGGARFHQPELAVYAIIAARGIERVWRALETRGSAVST